MEEWEKNYRKANDAWYYGLEPKYQELCDLLKEQTGIDFEVSSDSEWYKEQHIKPKDREGFEGKEPLREDFCPSHEYVPSKITHIIVDGEAVPVNVCKHCGRSED